MLFPPVPGTASRGLICFGSLRGGAEDLEVEGGLLENSVGCVVGCCDDGSVGVAFNVSKELVGGALGMESVEEGGIVKSISKQRNKYLAPNGTRL